MATGLKPKNRLNGHGEYSPIPKATKPVTEKKAKDKEPLAIMIRPMEIMCFRLRIEGMTSLICHAWSEKARLEMLQAQQRTGKEPKAAKKPKNPEEDFQNSLYKLPGGKFGFPAIAFKCACVKTSSLLAIKNGQNRVRAALHVFGPNRSELVELHGSPESRCDMVRVGPFNNRVADIRFRGEFVQWSTDLHIELDTELLSPEVAINLLNRAGFYCGAGDWRVEKNGSHGMFRAGELLPAVPAKNGRARK